MKKVLLALVVASVATIIGLAMMLETTPVQAQDQEDIVPAVRMSVPIEVSSIAPRTFPEPLDLTVSGRLVKAQAVLELQILVEAADMSALPPSLQPRLFIGKDSYEIHRVEYSNWDLAEERPMDPREPIADFQFLYFFVPAGENIERGLPMILTVLSSGELERLTDGTMDIEILRRVLPGVEGIVPIFDLDQ